MTKGVRMRRFAPSGVLLAVATVIAIILGVIVTAQAEPSVS